MGYLAPEKLSSFPAHLLMSHKVDVYAFGVVLWQLVSKQLKPFDTDVDPWQFIMSSAPLPASDAVTPAQLELVNACREYHPEQRPDMAVVSECLQVLRSDHAASPASIQHILTAARKCLPVQCTLAIRRCSWVVRSRFSTPCVHSACMYM